MKHWQYGIQLAGFVIGVSIVVIAGFSYFLQKLIGLSF